MQCCDESHKNFPSFIVRCGSVTLKIPFQGYVLGFTALKHKVGEYITNSLCLKKSQAYGRWMYSEYHLEDKHK